ncbi:hypothetical protein [Ekhidna sp.]
MSKKGTIEDQVKSLSEREEKLKLQLSSDSDEIKDKVKSVGKIALIAGLVALAGYWIFNAFADEDEKKPKKRKKKDKESGGVSSRLTALAVPYFEKLLSGFFDGKEDDRDMMSSEQENKIEEN